MVRSSIAGELDPAEFGPKLESKFFAYICFLISPFQGRRVRRSIGYQTRCRRRRCDLYSKPVGGDRSNGLLPRSHDASPPPHTPLPSICRNATLRKRGRIPQSLNERAAEGCIKPIRYNTLSKNIHVVYFFFLHQFNRSIADGIVRHETPSHNGYRTINIHDFNDQLLELCSVVNNNTVGGIFH